MVLIALALFGVLGHAGGCDRVVIEVANTEPVSTYIIDTPTPRRLGFKQLEVDQRIELALDAEAKRMKRNPRELKELKTTAMFLASELVKNAAMWGNAHDPKKKIVVKLYTSPEGITVSVKDQSERRFDPGQDSGSMRTGESHDQFEARRAEMGKPVIPQVTEGLFWTGVKNNNQMTYETRFDGGNEVIVRIPWDYKDASW